MANQKQPHWIWIMKGKYEEGGIVFWGQFSGKNDNEGIQFSWY